MSLANLFGWNTVIPNEELPDIFPMPILANEFVKTDIEAIYAKILIDTLERTHGLTDEQTALMWDNCVKSSAADGVVTLLAKAMSDKRDLFLVYERPLNVIRLADLAEQVAIRADYEKVNKSSKGIYISFKNYTRSDMVKLYIGLEYCTVASLYKSMNLSKAVQLKMNDLRGSVSLADAADVKSQAVTLATALAAGKDILLDAKDTIETSVPDLTATKESVSFLAKKLSFYLNMPASYLTGEQTSGIGSTGENDMRAVERGLKAYYFSVVKPVLEALFPETKLNYKSQDTRQIEGSMEVIKTFALIDDTLISAENKRAIVNRLLDLPEDAEGDPAPRPAPIPAIGAPAVIAQ
jgi:hypothetical protein